MAASSANWWTQQLAEYLAVVSSVDDAATARSCAVERATEALEAELGALVVRGKVVASLGFAAGHEPECELARVAEEMADRAEFPGLGPCSVAVARMSDGALVLGRLGDNEFSPEDIQLLRGMGRVLELVRRVEDRRNLLEQLSRVHATISRRASLDEVLGAVVAGAAGLVGDEMAALRLVDSADTNRTVMGAAHGYSTTLLRSLKGANAPMAAIALEDGKPVFEHDYANSELTMPELLAAGVTAMALVPVWEHGSVAGVISVCSTAPGRRYAQHEQDALIAYAEHASLALAAARSSDTLRQALNDPLTDLPNRTLLLNRLDHALARAARRGSAVSLLFVDLDRFKLVNDSLGHAAGDRLLIEVAERLKTCLRRADSAARLGGDEFALLLEEAGDLNAAAHAAQRVIEVLSAPFNIFGREIFTSASIGIAVGAGEDPDTMLRHADMAMYRAKSRGKSRYEVFEPDMHAEVVDRLALEAELRRAVELDELELHFQPIFFLDGSGIAAAEALVRWRHPVRGLLYPGSFISLAEESGLILKVGRWVLNEACRQAAAWQSMAPGVQVSVNLSGWQLEQPDVVQEVADALCGSGLTPRLLLLELTESLLMHDTEEMITKLAALRTLGTRLAIDDFGTGYSSLRYLQRFPIDALKIPKPFVDELCEGSPGVLARAIIDLSRHLELRTVAEGIETEEQLGRLREFGCAFGQGFLLAKPMPVENLRELLAAGEHVPAS
jgi:diguanylate cyclase (GGDEF)-like protein